MGQFAYNGEFTKANGSNGYGFADFVIDASEFQGLPVRQDVMVNANIGWHSLAKMNGESLLRSP